MSIYASANQPNSIYFIHLSSLSIIFLFALSLLTHFLFSCTLCLCSSLFVSIPLLLSLSLSLFLSLCLCSSLSLSLSLSLSHYHPFHLSPSTILFFTQPPILSLAFPSRLSPSLHTPFSSSLLFYLISYLLFLTSKTLATLSDSVAFLDYVTAYIACLSSDRIDGLYTTVGTSILFGGY